MNDWVDFYREKEKNAAKIICPAKAKRFQVTHFLRASLSFRFRAKSVPLKAVTVSSSALMSRARPSFTSPKFLISRRKRIIGMSGWTNYRSVMEHDVLKTGEKVLDLF